MMLSAEQDGSETDVIVTEFSPIMKAGMGPNRPVKTTGKLRIFSTSHQRRRNDTYLVILGLQKTEHDSQWRPTTKLRISQLFFSLENFPSELISPYQNLRFKTVMRTPERCKCVNWVGL